MSNAELAVSLHQVAAMQAAQYTWSVQTAAFPSGLNIRVGQSSSSSSMVISTNISRSFTGTATVVSGTVQLSNTAGARPLRLTAVQVMLQQQQHNSLLLLPQRVLADCPRTIASFRRTDYITLQPGTVLACPFAARLMQPSSAAITVTAQAAVEGAGMVASTPTQTWLSMALSTPLSGQQQQQHLMEGKQLGARTGSGDNNSSESVSGSSSSGSVLVGLGRCAVATDTFESGGLYLAPTALLSGVKLPPLGVGSSICEGSVNSVYRVSFGPFNSSSSSSSISCGTYKVRR